MEPDPQKSKPAQIEQTNEPRPPVPDVDQTPASHDEERTETRKHKAYKWLEDRWSRASSSKWIKKTRKPMVFFTFIIVLATIAQFVAGMLQWDATMKQLEAMLLQTRAMVKQTDDFAEQTRLISSQTKFMESQTKLLESQIKQAKIDAESSDKRAEETLRKTLAQSKSALDASIENSRLDQRPWLTIEEIKLFSEVQEGSPIFVTFKVRNNGKTPAFKQTTQTDMSLTLIPPATPPIPIFPVPRTLEDAPSMNIVAPGSPTATAQSKPWIPKPEGEESRILRAYLNRNARLYLYVMIRYKDVFGIPHWTRACAYHTVGNQLNAFVYCSEGNEIDGNQKPSDPVGPPGSDK